LIAQARTALFDPSFPLQEEIISLPESTVADLESQIKALDLAAKRALFAERVAKPVFFDNAFNYIDLPMDELLVKAGREPAKVETLAAASVAESVAQKVEKAAEEVKKTVVGRERTRESTPATESQQEEKPKGWLGGWFGRG
jgi:signal recognition particle subunit SRP68